MKWFRLYGEVLHDSKVQILSPARFRDWINLLLIVNGNTPRGSLPPISQVAFLLRVGVEEAQAVVNDLIVAGLFDVQPDGSVRAHNWDVRQPESDEPRQYPKDWLLIRTAVFARDHYTCRYCGTSGVKLYCDHIHPYSRGGTTDLDNLVTACFRCNASKKDKTIVEWVLCGGRLLRPEANHE